MRKQNIVNRRSVLEAAGDYRIKATLGITGWLCLSVHSDGTVRHLNESGCYASNCIQQIFTYLSRGKKDRIVAYNGGLHIV